MGMLGQDIRYGFRALRRNPLLSLTVIILMAIGVGATTAVFGILSSLLIRPLPYPQPDRIVYVRGRSREGRASNASYLDYKDWQQQATSLDQLSCCTFRDRAISTAGEESPQECSVGFVSTSFFRVFSVRPLLGRLFLQADEQPSATPPAVISYALWQRQFAEDPDVLGKSILIGGSQYTVVGVTPVAFRFLPYGEPSADVWVIVSPAIAGSGRGNRNLRVLGRLRANATVAALQAEIDTICGRLAAAYPSTNDGMSATVMHL